MLDIKAWLWLAWEWLSSQFCGVASWDAVLLGYNVFSIPSYSYFLKLRLDTSRMHRVTQGIFREYYKFFSEIFLWRQIPNPKQIVRMLKYTWWKSRERFAQDLHYENTKIGEFGERKLKVWFINFSIFVMSCASFYLIPPGIFQHR